MKKDSYENGCPSWIDYETTDLEASKKFYGGLFGWKFTDAGEETGHYNVVSNDNGDVGGLMPAHGEMGHPPMWSTYISVNDIDTTMKSANNAGATTIVEPVDVMGQGKMAYFIDPQGGSVGLWEPQARKGAGVVNEAGAFTWAEYTTRDLEGGTKFYSEVFGLKASEFPMGDRAGQMFAADGRNVASAIEMSDKAPADMPTYWQVYFGTSDADATCATAKKLGGQVLAEPVETPFGPMAMLSDPVGAVFSVLELKP